MPEENLDINSEEVLEIITDVPSWIVRWGITVVFLVIGGIILLSALIEYPDVIKTNLRITSLNSPRTVLAKQSGKLTTIMIKDGTEVKQDQVLAYFETTANPDDILKLLAKLIEFQGVILKSYPLQMPTLPTNLNLGEMQGSYQNFYQEYLQYKSTLKDGNYSKQIAFLEKDLKGVKDLREQIIELRKVQLREYANVESEYHAYKNLYDKKVISRSEFSQQENKYLSAKYPLQQTETSMLNNSSNYITKERELAVLRNTIIEQQAKFIQALNQCITGCEAWIQQFTLRAPVAGKLSFAGAVQQNQNVLANQEIFMVNPGNTDFFGEVRIPQYNMGKIRLGQRTLIKLKSYPFEQYGMVRGKLTYISDAAYNDSVFIAKVSLSEFEKKGSGRKIVLKNGMQADAEIITEESSLLQRFFRSISKMLNSSN